MASGASSSKEYWRPSHRLTSEPAPRVGECVCCSGRFEVGDPIARIPLGPGADEKARAACREGGDYMACAVLVHWACATGVAA